MSRPDWLNVRVNFPTVAELFRARTVPEGSHLGPKETTQGGTAELHRLVNYGNLPHCFTRIMITLVIPLVNGRYQITTSCRNLPQFTQIQ